MIVHLRRAGSYRYDLWTPTLRETRSLRAVASMGEVVSLSNEARIMTPVRLEPQVIEFALPKTRQVRGVLLNGQPQPKIGQPVERGHYLQWAAGAGRLTVYVVRPLPEDCRLEVAT